MGMATPVPPHPFGDGEGGERRKLLSFKNLFKREFLF
jgi:hypothetical protein